MFLSINVHGMRESLSIRRERCNDFSIGIELEGTDTLAYTDAQYQQLAAVTRALIDRYPDIANNMTGHCDIAPDRKNRSRSCI